jgi:hypothetical protein
VASQEGLSSKELWGKRRIQPWLSIMFVMTFYGEIFNHKNIIQAWYVHISNFFGYAILVILASAQLDMGVEFISFIP